MRPLAVLALCAGAAALACSSQQRAQPRPTTVSAADLGRLSPEQMGQVQSARSDLDAARDALDRARLRLQDAHHEEWYARADRTQADADRQRGEAQLRTAQEAGDGRAAARARELLAAAALRTQAADARLDYARKLVAARQAGVDAYQARVQRAEWDVERAKLAALRAAQVPAATKYDAAALDRQAGDLARSEDASVARSRDLDRQATAAFDRWRSLVDRYEAGLRASGQTG